MAQRADDRAEVGCRAWAETVGQLGNAGCPLYMARSRLKGAGLGVFTSIDLPAGSYVTTYDGILFSGHLGLDDVRIPSAVVDYALQLSSNERRPGLRPSGTSQPQRFLLPVYDPAILVHRRSVQKGVVKRSKRKDRRRGAGHMLNDAIHMEVTGHTNNCTFKVPDDPRATFAYIKTCTAVPAGTELLVSYHVSYWAGRALSHERLFPTHVLEFCRAMRRAQRTLSANGLDLEAYLGQGRYSCQRTGVQEENPVTVTIEPGADGSADGSVLVLS
jgi:hypothetical protein